MLETFTERKTVTTDSDKLTTALTYVRVQSSEQTERKWRQIQTENAGINKCRPFHDWHSHTPAQRHDTQQHSDM